MISEHTIKDIRTLLRELTKVIKVVSMYPLDNPLPNKLRESFAMRFVDLIEEIGNLHLGITRDEVRFGDEIVFQDKGGDDRLAAIFYRSGITELLFLPRFGVDQCQALFNILKAYMNKESGAGDLVAMLWEADLTGFTYATLEDVYLAEYTAQCSLTRSTDGDDGLKYRDIFRVTELDDPDAPTITWTVPLSPEEQMAEENMGLAPTPAKKPDPLPETSQILSEAFALEKEDTERIRQLISGTFDQNHYALTINLLHEILYQQHEFPEFSETVTIVEKIQTEFLGHGQLGYAAELLHLLENFSAGLDQSRTGWKERVHEALTLAGGRERLKALAAALNENESITPAEIDNYLDVFDWEALMVLTDLLGDLEYKEHRLALVNYLAKTGHEHIDLISKAVFDRRWYVVRNSVSILARIGGDKAFTYLEKVLGHEETRVRLELARSLAVQNNDQGAALLGKLIWDPDDKVVRTAMQILSQMTPEAMLPEIIRVINDDRFAALKEIYQETFLLNFSRFAGEKAVKYLSRMISPWKLWQTQTQRFYQQTAIKALSINRSECALQALEKLARSRRRKIRQAAAEALAGREGTIREDRP